MKFEDLKGGLTVDEALAAFRDGVGGSFWKHKITSGYFDQEFASGARAALPERITDEQATVMRRIVEGTLSMPLPWFLAWVEEAADRNPDEYVAEVRASLMRRFQQRNYEAWQPNAPPRETGLWSFSAKTEEAVSAAKAEHSHWIQPCPSCGSPPSELHWRYGRFGFRDEEESDWKGWVVTCERCQLGIDLVGAVDEAPTPRGPSEPATQGPGLPGLRTIKNPYGP